MAKGSERAHEEDDVRLPILEVLGSGGSWTTQDLTRAVRARLNLFSFDLAPAAPGRPNEQKIDQIIANALQEHRRLCASGLVERTNRGIFRLTDKGAKFLGKFREDVEWGVAWLQANYPDIE